MLRKKPRDKLGEAGRGERCGAGFPFGDSPSANRQPTWSHASGGRARGKQPLAARRSSHASCPDRYPEQLEGARQPQCDLAAALDTSSSERAAALSSRRRYQRKPPAPTLRLAEHVDKQKDANVPSGTSGPSANRGERRARCLKRTPRKTGFGTTPAAASERTSLSVRRPRVFQLLLVGGRHRAIASELILGNSSTGRKRYSATHATAQASRGERFCQSC